MGIDNREPRSVQTEYNRVSYVADLIGSKRLWVSLAAAGLLAVVANAGRTTYISSEPVGFQIISLIPEITPTPTAVSEIKCLPDMQECPNIRE